MRRTSPTRALPHCCTQWRRLAVVLSALALDACTVTEANAPSLSREIYDVPLGTVNPQPGVSEHQVLVNGARRRLGLWIPPEGVTDNHPVILFLYGAKRRPNFRFLHWFIEPELAELSPIVIAPEANLGKGGEWWRGEEASYALGLLRSVVLNWPVDDRRVVVMGYSNGGIGTWVFARAFPQHFTAAIPMAFNHSVVGATPLPVFAIQGERDELFGSTEVVEAVEDLQQRGFNMRVRVAPRATHGKGDYHPQLEEARRWLVDSVWAGLPNPH